MPVKLKHSPHLHEGGWAQVANFEPTYIPKKNFKFEFYTVEILFLLAIIIYKNILFDKMKIYILYCFFIRQLVEEFCVGMRFGEEKRVRNFIIHVANPRFLGSCFIYYCVVIMEEIFIFMLKHYVLSWKISRGLPS